MIETELGQLRRSHYSNDLNASMDGTQVTVMGWVLTVRGHGNISFATVRDKNGDLSIVAKMEIALTRYVKKFLHSNPIHLLV